MQNYEEIGQTMQQLQSLDLLLADINIEEVNQLLSRDTAELTRLAEFSDMDEFVKKLTFEDFVKLPFNDAKAACTKMTMLKRLTMLDELTSLRKAYYEATKNYVGADKDSLLTEKEFRSLLGKIKHLEILQNWLYGIA